ncbi:putative phosphatase PhoE [Leifsonia sp. LS1]|uniref:histidine phosphatase family protein n=1 Tax=unclassified Leifsonia TaxID=2663824 RepID=UPI001CBE751B|nr:MULTISPECIES: histidine phosphatase family protein [unclassified Leifsonia]UAJ77858.1 histidine phosphatase family protein [Leifsonia sp. ZF2019]GIT81728.1 putative phosphatase PhoE [Leifsonia sp. LS1]
MTLISLVRHGQTDWNLARRIQGSSDIPLNDTGRAQAEATGRALAGGRFDAIYASPLGRAFETASIISSHLGLGEPTPLPALVERHYGEAEGLTGAEILERWPEGTPVPGRETREQVVERALPALVELGESHPGESILVVSHGGVIGSLVRQVTDHALPGPGEVIPNGSVHRFVYVDGALRLDRFNLGPEDRDLLTASVM